MRKSLKWDIDNLFKSPETAEAEFQRKFSSGRFADSEGVKFEKKF